MTAATLELVIFDCDGVLVDSEPIVNRAFVEVLRRDGVNLDPEQSLERFTGASLASRVATVRAEFGWQPLASFNRDFHARLDELVERELCPVPGVQQVLERIETRRCVASNGSLAEMRARLGKVGLVESFSHLFTATERERSKPFPDVYLHAAEVMGVPPVSCAVVEDSVPGVQAGIAAGMTVFAYSPRSDGDDLALLGAHVFASMDQLPGLLRAGSPSVE